MTIHKVSEPMDRRVSGTTTNGRNVWIERLRTRAIKSLQAHDESFQGLDPEMWQTWYSLTDHSLRVEEKVVASGLLAGSDDRLIGILHDIGKMHPDCHIYRLNRYLTPEERLMIKTHSLHSAMRALDYIYDVRFADIEFISKRHAPVCLHHHNPDIIPDEDERRAAKRLCMVDVIQGLTEKRHRPAYKLEPAIDKTSMWLMNVVLPSLQLNRRSEFEEAFEIAVTVFRADLSYE